MTHECLNLKHLYICSVYLCICVFVHLYSSVYLLNMQMAQQSFHDAAFKKICCRRDTGLLLEFFISFLLFFFLKYVVKKNATFNSTAVLSFGRSCCQHRRVNSSKTWSVLLKLMTYGILHLQWNISHTRLRGSGCLPITFAQQLNIAMGKTYHDWIKMFVIPYE